MKKIISATLAILCTMSMLSACGNSSGAPAEEDTSVSTEAQSGDYVIRNVNWGMTMDEVKSAETAELEEEKEEKALYYKNIEMFGQKFDLTYAFSWAKGLHTAVYTSPNILKSDSSADELEKVIFNTLTEKYGESEYNSTLGMHFWYFNGTEIRFHKGSPKDNDGLVFFRITYTIDEKADQRSDNGNL